MRLLFFLKKKLCILQKEDYKEVNKSYFIGQLVSYNENKAISHILKHKNEDNALRFKEEFPLEEIYFKLRNILPMENRWIWKGMSNCYVIKYIDSGYAKEKRVNYFKVITLLNSNDIITMYPTVSKGNYYHLDLTPTIEEGEDLKLKRISQIDKFNQKYGNKKRP